MRTFCSPATNNIHTYPAPKTLESVKERMSNTSFGDLITKILEEPNATILSKYHAKGEDATQAMFEKKRQERQRAMERKEMRDENCIVPTVATNAKHEKLLRDIATRGVVTLFNAIPKHQKELKKNLESIDSNNDIFKQKTLKAEEKSRNELIKSLNKKGKTKLETTNDSNFGEPSKKRRKISNNNDLNKSDAAKTNLPKHLQSILMDHDQ